MWPRDDFSDETSHKKDNQIWCGGSQIKINPLDPITGWKRQPSPKTRPTQSSSFLEWKINKRIPKLIGQDTYMYSNVHFWLSSPCCSQQHTRAHSFVLAAAISRTRFLSFLFRINSPAISHFCLSLFLSYLLTTSSFLWSGNIHYGFRFCSNTSW